MAIVMLVFSQPLLLKIATWKVWPWKFRSRSQSEILATVSFDGKDGLVRWQRWSRSMAKMVSFDGKDGLVRWQISTSIKDILEHFSLVLTVFEIFTFQYPWPWKRRSRPWCITFAVAPFDLKYQASNLVATVMFAPSLTVCEIFANLIECQHFDLDNEGQGQEKRD